MFCKKLIINQKRKKVRSHAIFRLDYQVDRTRVSRGNRACAILGCFCLNRSYRRNLRDSRALWFPFWYKLRSTYFPSKEIYICIRFNFKQVVYNCSFFFTILKYYLEYKLTQLYEASRKRCMTIHVTFSERDWFYVAWWPKIAYAMQDSLHAKASVLFVVMSRVLAVVWYRT